MNKIKIDIKNQGELILELRPDVAPNHVNRFIELVRAGFYNGKKFHRVVPGFVVQAGCPNGDGTGRTGVGINAEFSDNKFTGGALGMARGFDVDSADCQFFITLDTHPHLDGQYTYFGHVIENIDLLKNIKKNDIINTIEII